MDVSDRRPNIDTEFYIRFGLNIPLTIGGFYIQIYIS